MKCRATRQWLWIYRNIFWSRHNVFCTWHNVFFTKPLVPSTYLGYGIEWLLVFTCICLDLFVVPAGSNIQSWNKSSLKGTYSCFFKSIHHCLDTSTFHKCAIQFSNLHNCYCSTWIYLQPLLYFLSSKYLLLIKQISSGCKWCVVENKVKLHCMLWQALLAQNVWCLCCMTIQ